MSHYCHSSVSSMQLAAASAFPSSHDHIFMCEYMCVNANCAAYLLVLDPIAINWLHLCVLYLNILY